MLFLMMVAVAAVMLVLMLFLMMVAVAAVMLVVMLFLMMMAMAAVVVMLHFSKGFGNGVLAFHCFQQLIACQLIPGSGDECRIRIMLPEQCNGSIQLSLYNITCTGQDDGGSRFDLVIVELTEVLHVNLDLGCIHHSYRTA